MGKRSRERTRSGTQGVPAPAPVIATGGRRRESVPGVGLSDVNRTLAAYLGGAFFLALIVIAGIVFSGGTLGPLVVLVVTLAGAATLFRWARRRLDGAVLSDQDRMVQTMAGGLLGLCVVLALAATIIIAVA